MKDKLFIKDAVDGQQHCLSGDEQFYLIDVTDDYLKSNPERLEEAVESFVTLRRRVIGILELALACGAISQKERDIMYRRKIDWMSLEEVGKEFGVTRERIRQIEAKVTEKLRTD